MEEPPGFEKPRPIRNVCEFQRSLYGPKQVLRAWYEKIENLLINSGFVRCGSESNYFVRRVDDHVLVIVLHVDDFIITGIPLLGLEQ
uniref:Reverse transcriptase Ty1/copia-type domain-containing protein n=1 Tax=Picea glauca TaxID=3330 RepID=A0A101LWX0_PICGL|nr:hypothetical protein ABT39_MTgene6319 [Picea glauca]